jgi:DNA-binding transcriptional LysR family regulator
MNYELIKNFITVANTLNITRSSEILFVSQSTVSHRLQLLESTLGHPLIYRGRGKRLASLTEHGRTFLPIAEKWLALWQETEQFRSEAPLQHLRVACVESLATCFIFDFLVAFSSDHPNIRLSIQTLSSAEIYQQMEQNQLDLGIVLNYVPRQGLQSRPLLSEKMYCVCTKDICNDGNRIDINMLDPSKEIFLNWGVEFTLWHDYRFSTASSPLLSVNSIDLIEQAMQKFSCWSIVPETVANYFCAKNLCMKIPLKYTPPDRVSYIIASAMPAPTTATQIDTLVEELDTYIAAKVLHKD